ncbi:ATP-binding cassette domain-containing protein [Anaerocolumna sp. AGMB13025]|uniref:ATP-binding cassette domain-containing protein n=1 Tax=Anaerocolumna sp. AGMB13025 TaxID=3039116 RepID=UPI0024203B99|nr:ATP-binding cassette domain-containing protein [Anaerocolumna sp. AGMB13025]WFR56448.1 ATP-binding cassette domain-containing protein [Anaerocolumna sp. AGMB13025]
MLDIKNVTISKKEDSRLLIKDFNFTLNQGDKAVIIGEEGNGKSTLLKFIYSKELLENYCDYSGQILGHNKMGYLEQEMEEKWLNCTVQEFLAEVDLYSCSDPGIWTMNLEPSIFNSSQLIKTLSGGEKVKLRLIKLLAEEPDVLLMDEPTNDLDISTLLWLEEFINNTKCPIIYVSHDEAMIENTANIIIHLEQVKRKTEPHYTVAYMSYEEYAQKRLSGLKKQEMVARKQREDYKSKMQRWQQIYNKVDSQQDNISRGNPAGGRLLKKKMKNLLSQEKRIEKKAEEFLEIPDVEEAILFDFPEGTQIPNGKKILEYSLEVLKVRNEGEDRVLAENLFLRVIGPEHVAIIGDNGTGKTTFLHGIVKELLSRRDIKAGYMPQNYEEILDYTMNPVDFLVSSGRKEDITKAFTFMGGMKFTREEMEHKIGELSGGQKAKLILLKLILDGCNVLILDEPTRNLSPLSNPVIRGVLSEYKGTIISITHDRKYIEEVATTVYELTRQGLKRIDFD